MKNKPSRTALDVASNILTLGAMPEMQGVLPDGLVESTAELLLASGAMSQMMVKLARSPRMITVYRMFDWMLPGQFEAFGWRKAFCERQVRREIEKGAEQVVVLGAGYDTLAIRLAPEFKSVKFFEIDHPSTMRLKLKGVESMGRVENHLLIAADLGHRKLETVLNETPTWIKGGWTVFIAEGLLMYLPTEAVADLLSQCARVSKEESSIVFSYAPFDKNESFDIGRFGWVLLFAAKALSEPWFWGIRPEKLAQFMSEFGWRVEEDLVEKRGVEFFVKAAKHGP